MMENLHRRKTLKIISKVYDYETKYERQILITSDKYAGFRK